MILFYLALNQDLKKNNKSKKEIVFSNNEDVDAYLDMFDNSFNKLKVHYVDSVNESEMIKEGIKGMMKKMDPYTKLLEGSSKDSYDVLRKGKYGGVGIQMGVRRDTLTVLSPMEDSPAYSEGIHAGDQIIMVDTTSTIGMTTSEAAAIIKGEIGSTVTLGIFRPSTKERINFELERSNITVKHVPYWGIDENNIGYIRITRFSKNVSKDFKKALLEMDGEEYDDLNDNNNWDKAEKYNDSNKNGIWDKGEGFTDKNNNGKWDDQESFIDYNNNQKYDRRGRLEGLVIDLRGNSGGLLSNATAILDYLCTRGDVLLSSRGKANRANKEWKSRRKPIVDIDVPIAVLINKSSASASEIVAGALQDLDRAVIIGQKSFGKGLVQHMFDLNDTTTLKITTAKYYLPSGRLIQKQDYLNNGFLTDGLDEKDSLFVTKSGRVVKGGGGIYPDVKTGLSKKSNYINALWREGMFLSFAASYVPFHDNLSIPLYIDNKIVNDFKTYLKDFDISYSLPGEKDLEKLKEKISKSSISINKYSKNISMTKNSTIVSEAYKYFKQVKKVQFSMPENKKWIKNGLLREMSRILSGNKESIKVSLFEDDEYNKAVEILTDLKEYDSLLGL